MLNLCIDTVDAVPKTETAFYPRCNQKDFLLNNKIDNLLKSEMIDISSHQSIQHGPSTPLTFRMSDIPLTFWMSDTPLTFVPNVRHSSYVDGNNCLHAGQIIPRSTYVFQFAHLRSFKFIPIGMIVSNNSYMSCEQKKIRSVWRRKIQNNKYSEIFMVCSTTILPDRSKTQNLLVIFLFPVDFEAFIL